MDTVQYANNLANTLKAVLGVRGKLDYLTSLTQSKKVSDWSTGGIQKLKYMLYSMPHMFNMLGDMQIFYMTASTTNSVYALTKMEAVPNDERKERIIANLKELFSEIKVLDRDIKLLNSILYTVVVAVYSDRKDLLTLCFFTLYTLRKEV